MITYFYGAAATFLILLMVCNDFKPSRIRSIEISTIVASVALCALSWVGFVLFIIFTIWHIAEEKNISWDYKPFAKKEKDNDK